MHFVASLVSSREFMPHGYCYLWDRGLIWIHLVLDGLIALAKGITILQKPFSMSNLSRAIRDALALEPQGR